MTLTSLEPREAERLDDARFLEFVDHLQGWAQKFHAENAWAEISGHVAYLHRNPYGRTSWDANERAVLDAAAAWGWPAVYLALSRAMRD